MGGGDCHDGDDSGIPDATLLLVGKVGNGKSATGNSILGRDAFASKRSFRSVTLGFQKESATLHDGRVVNVIDTPGLVNTGGAAGDVHGEDIIQCMSMAKDGIHAVLVVFSAASRFSEEDVAAIQSIHKLFGERLIMAFTHGDEVEEDEFKGMLNDAPKYIRGMVRLCKDRVVLFDNRTKDSQIQAGQVKELFDQVDSMLIYHQAMGQPFSDQMRQQEEREREEPEEVELEKGLIQTSGVQSAVGKPWYVQTYEYLKYAAGVVWNKICCLCRKMVDTVKGKIENTKKQGSVKIVSCGYAVQRRMLRPKLVTSYRLPLMELTTCGGL